MISIIQCINHIIGDGEEIVIDFESLDFVNLMTFPGAKELDNTRPDATSDPIYIPDGLIFGDELVTSAYVSLNCEMRNIVYSFGVY